MRRSNGERTQFRTVRTASILRLNVRPYNGLEVVRYLQVWSHGRDCVCSSHKEMHSYDRNLKSAATTTNPAAETAFSNKVIAIKWDEIRHSAEFSLHTTTPHCTSVICIQESLSLPFGAGKLKICDNFQL
jgi:hypothetical protein